MGRIKKLRPEAKQRPKGKDGNNANASIGNQVELSILHLILFFFKENSLPKPNTTNTKTTLFNLKPFFSMLKKAFISGPFYQ